MRGRVQKMMVGGGCSIDSSSSAAAEDFFLEVLLGLEDVRFLDPRTGSGGARRRWRVGSGGLQRRW